MDRWFDRNNIIVVLFMGQLCFRFFIVLTPLITRVDDLILDALRTFPVSSLYFEVNEALLIKRREKLALQYYTHLQPCSSNPAFECIIIPQYKLFLLERSRPFQLLILEFNQYWMTEIV